MGCENLYFSHCSLVLVIPQVLAALSGDYEVGHNQMNMLAALLCAA
jgi:hypothetical protein